jgi:hypothetical protein
MRVDANDRLAKFMRRGVGQESEDVALKLALIARLPSHHHRITRADSQSTESSFALHREGLSTSSVSLRKARDEAR